MKMKCVLMYHILAIRLEYFDIGSSAAINDPHKIKDDFLKILEKNNIKYSNFTYNNIRERFSLILFKTKDDFILFKLKFGDNFEVK